MMREIKVQVGGSLQDDLTAFKEAWKRAESGDYREERILSFESWEGLSSVMTGERYRLLRHLHSHPEKSVNALALALKRQYRRVHQDVTVLERAGLVERSDGEVRATADKLSAVVVL
jgi:predicted transcriptional regulator